MGLRMPTQAIRAAGLSGDPHLDAGQVQLPGIHSASPIAHHAVQIPQPDGHRPDE